MERKIIELNPADAYCKCLLCGKMGATVKMTINRTIYNDSVVTFNMCDECLSRAQQDIQKICE
jgi:hypothetical protein